MSAETQAKAQYLLDKTDIFNMGNYRNGSTTHATFDGATNCAEENECEIVDNMFKVVPQVKKWIFPLRVIYIRSLLPNFNMEGLTLSIELVFSWYSNNKKKDNILRIFRYTYRFKNICVKSTYKKEEGITEANFNNQWNNTFNFTNMKYKDSYSANVLNHFFDI